LKPEDNGITYLKGWNRKKKCQHRILNPLKISFKGWCIAQVIEDLLSPQEALSSNPNINKKVFFLMYPSKLKIR
jgi:hypothetical protein